MRMVEHIVALRLGLGLDNIMVRNSATVRQGAWTWSGAVLLGRTAGAACCLYYAKGKQLRSAGQMAVFLP